MSIIAIITAILSFIGSLIPLIVELIGKFA